MFRSVLRRFLTPKSCAPIRKPARSVLRMENLEDRTVPSATFGTTTYATIQAALNAAAAHPGADTVTVSAGSYTEALVVNDASAVTLKASGAVTIKAPAAVSTVTLGSVNIGGAVIDIYSKNVTVDGFKVDATGSNANAGIRVIKGGSATIKNNTVVGVISPLDPISGIGIQVGTSLATGTNGAGTAKVTNNTVSNYLGAGVLVDGANGSATVKGNAITGRGLANGGVAQYGVQVSLGATARVEGNTISGNDSDGAVAGGSNPAVASAGIFFYQDGGKNSVAALNNIFGNDDGILVQNSSGTCAGSIEIVNNDVHGNNGFAAIHVLFSSNIDVENNDVFSNTAWNGIALGTSSGVNVENNDVFNNANADGIYVFGGANNVINCNDSYSNGFNGIFVEQSVNNLLWNNSTWGNAENGIKVLGGTSNDIWFGDSIHNVKDGIALIDTTYTTVVGNDLSCNGGAGLRLTNADHTYIAYNLVAGNANGQIVIDAASTNVIQIGNRTSTMPVRDGSGGSCGSSSHYTNSHSNSDDDCRGLDD